jgi:hemoglobin
VGDEHRRHVTIWWCEVMGGAPEYTEKLGGYEHMLGRHLGLQITRRACDEFCPPSAWVPIAIR